MKSGWEPTRSAVATSSSTLCAGFPPGLLHFRVSSPPRPGESSRDCWPKSLGTCSHVGDPKRSFWLPASNRLCYGHCGHLWSEPDDIRLSLWKPAIQIKKSIKKIWTGWLAINRQLNDRRVKVILHPCGRWSREPEGQGWPQGAASDDQLVTPSAVWRLPLCYLVR